MLRVDGHTDVRPTGGLRTNWDLSAARAIAVVQYLISKGMPPQRLVAAGFGEFQPIDPANTDEAYSRNRRIELKLRSGEPVRSQGPPLHAADEDAAIKLWQRSWQDAYPDIDFAARVGWWRERWRGELVPQAKISSPKWTACSRAS